MKKYAVLRATMRAKKCTLAKLAEMANCTVQSVHNKLEDKTDWTLTEMLAIRDGLESDEKLDILFFRG